ncbi:hypothetical protein FIBSPDRAFT_902857 [Athelia psychrophila]|uniref:Uncharacterized protein n=1 Tax=Athelia psychrophila TaxID=1759441 RepID=A0A167WQN7_9AGAM|nr:hypothetical protein FIBSPDRAFT_902857 [Fibularhizoctonia sp. CBS 109695]
MQFFKSTLFVAIAVTTSFVAAAPSPADQTQCLSLIQPCTKNAECCTNKCIASTAEAKKEVGKDQAKGKIPGERSLGACVSGADDAVLGKFDESKYRGSAEGSL